jgi:hypothetical protein
MWLYDMEPLLLILIGLIIVVVLAWIVLLVLVWLGRF